MPTTLYETIMFLNIASAVATVRDKFENVDMYQMNMYHMARFKEDLSCWEFLFAADPIASLGRLLMICGMPTANIL